jgi:hypothetical protein
VPSVVVSTVPVVSVSVVSVVPVVPVVAGVSVVSVASVSVPGSRSVAIGGGGSVALSVVIGSSGSGLLRVDPHSQLRSKALFIPSRSTPSGERNPPVVTS